jgi:Uncharacterized protein conserved in bacteria (DUF2188)
MQSPVRAGSLGRHRAIRPGIGDALRVAVAVRSTAAGRWAPAFAPEDASIRKLDSRCFADRPDRGTFPIGRDAQAGARVRWGPKEEGGMRGWVHTVLRGGVWVTEIEGQGPLYRHESESEAMEEGAEAARQLGTRHVIHDPDGQVTGAIDYEDGCQG